MLSPVTSSTLVPPPTGSGRTLRPRSPSAPKPGFVVQSPDSRVSLRRASFSGEVGDLPNPDLNDSPFDSDQDQEPADSSIEIIEELSAPPKKLKQAPPSKSKSATTSKVRPRGSGASAGLPRVRAKKQKRTVTAPALVSLYHHFFQMMIQFNDVFFYIFHFIVIWCLHLGTGDRGTRHHRCQSGLGPRTG